MDPIHCTHTSKDEGVMILARACYSRCIAVVFPLLHACRAIPLVALALSKLCAKLESAQLRLVVYLLEKSKLITVQSFGQFSSDHAECLSWQVNDTIDEL